MDKILYVVLAAVLTAVGYFLGVQSGQQKMQAIELQQSAMLRAENIGQHIQYVTLLNLGKTDELKLLLRSRVLSEKTQLEMQTMDPALSDNLLLKDAIATADSVLKPDA